MCITRVKRNTSINNFKNVNLPFLQSIRFNIFPFAPTKAKSKLKKQLQSVVSDRLTEKEITCSILDGSAILYVVHWPDKGVLNKYITRKSITCYYMLYKGVATCYLNLLVISSCCFDTNSEMFLMIHLYQIAQLKTNGHYIFKQLSESVAQIMSQKMFLKTP